MQHGGTLTVARARRVPFSRSQVVAVRCVHFRLGVGRPPGPLGVVGRRAPGDTIQDAPGLGRPVRVLVQMPGQEVVRAVRFHRVGSRVPDGTGEGGQEDHQEREEVRHDCAIATERQSSSWRHAHARWCNRVQRRDSSIHNETGWLWSNITRTTAGAMQVDGNSDMT